MPTAGIAAGGEVSAPTGCETRANAARIAGDAAIDDASMRRTASLVNAAVSTMNRRASDELSMLCVTCMMRIRTCHGGRSAGWMCGCIAARLTTMAFERMMRSATDSTSDVFSSESQPRVPGLVARMRMLMSDCALLLQHSRGLNRRPNTSVRSSSASAFGTENTVGIAGSSYPAWIDATYWALALVHVATMCASA
jgi:hypothetical protein